MGFHWDVSLSLLCIGWNLTSKVILPRRLCFEIFNSIIQVLYFGNWPCFVLSYTREIENSELISLQYMYSGIYDEWKNFQGKLLVKQKAASPVNARTTVNILPAELGLDNYKLLQVCFFIHFYQIFKLAAYFRNLYFIHTKVSLM